MKLKKIKEKLKNFGYYDFIEAAGDIMALLIGLSFAAALLAFSIFLFSKIG